jgi:hypothetical protein
LAGANSGQVYSVTPDVTDVTNGLSVNANPIDLVVAGSGNGTIKGNVAADGVAKLTVTNSKGTNTQTAYAAFNSQGQLIVVVIDTGSAANTVLTLTQQ